MEKTRRVEMFTPKKSCSVMEETSSNGIMEYYSLHMNPMDCFSILSAPLRYLLEYGTGVGPRICAIH